MKIAKSSLIGSCHLGCALREKEPIERGLLAEDLTEVPRQIEPKGRGGAGGVPYQLTSHDLGARVVRPPAFEYARVDIDDPVLADVSLIRLALFDPIEPSAGRRQDLGGNQKLAYRRL